MAAFQEEYARQPANRTVYSIPCADHVLNLVCQVILKKLSATTDESYIQDLVESTNKVNTEEVESDIRDSATNYATTTTSKRRKTTSTYAKRRTNVAPEGLNTWAKIRWITGKLHQQQHLIRSLQRNITRFTSDGIRMIRPTIDVPTRWNSFYYMLRNFSQSRRAIEEVIRRYPRDFTNLELLDSDWLIIAKLRRALSYIKVLSDFF
jgi:hypothetical protein